MMGIPESPITGVSIENFVVDMKQGEVTPEQPAMAYGIPKMAKQGMKLYNVKDVLLRDIRVTAEGDSAVTVEDSQNVTIEAIMVSASAQDKPVISMKNVKTARITRGAGTEKSFAGEKCDDIEIN